MQLRAVDLIKLRLAAEITETIAGLTPQELATPEISAQIEKANTAAQDELPARFGYMITLVRDVIAVAAVIITLANMSLLAAVLVLLSLLPVFFAANRATAINVKLWDAIGHLYWRARYLHQTLVSSSTSRELNSLGAAARIGDMVSSVYTSITDARKKTYLPILSLRLLTAVASAAILAGALIALTSGVNYGPAAAGGVYGIMSAMGTVAGLGTNLGAMIESVAPYMRYSDLQKLRRPHIEHTHKAPIAALKVRNVTFTYPNSNKPSLSNFSLEARRGDVIAIVGVNGAGKSTAVNCIVGSLLPQSGSITIDGVEQSAHSSSDWGSYFGVLTQDFGKYELTVRETLCLGLTGTRPSDDALWEALEGADAATLVHSFPSGLDQQLGSQWPQGVGVSGGQWQRLSLARTILRDAPVWILDEPTSAIDAESEQEIFNALQRQRADRVTIVVSHRAWTLKGMNEIIVVEQGEIVEQGTYSELLNLNGRFASIFSEQV